MCPRHLKRAVSPPSVIDVTYHPSLFLLSLQGKEDPSPPASLCLPPSITPRVDAEIMMPMTMISRHRRQPNGRQGAIFPLGHHLYTRHADDLSFWVGLKVGKIMVKLLLFL